MITSARFTKGYPLKLANVGDRLFEFKPGLNVVFGANGCGKSTLLKLLAKTTGCPESHGLNTTKKTGEAAMFGGWGRADFEGTVEHDKGAVYWEDTTKLDVPITAFGLTDMDMGDEVARCTARTSAGELRMWNHDFMAHAIKRVVIDSKQPLTVLLDEPERALSIPKQADQWLTNAQIAKKVGQIIIASHSPFALMFHGSAVVNYIEMTPGIIKESLGALRLVSSLAKDLKTIDDQQPSGSRTSEGTSSKAKRNKGT
jgi:predicted ATPase